jgi:hypothetical protein
VKWRYFNRYRQSGLKKGGFTDKPVVDRIGQHEPVYQDLEVVPGSTLLPYGFI